MWKNIGSPHNIREWLLSNVFVCENLSNSQFRCVQWMGKKMLLKAEGSKLCRKGNAGVNDPHVLSLISSFFWLRRIEIIYSAFCRSETWLESSKISRQTEFLMKVALGFVWVFAGRVLRTLLVSLDSLSGWTYSLFPIPFLWMYVLLSRKSHTLP